jgi:hypothetical protein
MTREIRSQFGPPIFKGNYCIYKNNLNHIYRVVHYGGDDNIEIDYGGGTKKAKTSELTWLPTAKEIQQNFLIQENDGFWQDFGNFLRDPTYFDYSHAELRYFRSEEEKWLIYCMRQMIKPGRLFKENRWISAQD